MFLRTRPKWLRCRHGRQWRSHDPHCMTRQEQRRRQNNVRTAQAQAELWATKASAVAQHAPVFVLVASISFMLISDIDSPGRGRVRVAPQKLIGLSEFLHSHWTEFAMDAPRVPSH